MADDGPRELTPPNKGFLLRAQKYLVLFGIGYFALLGLLTIPYFQLHAIFMHAAKWPLFATFDKPEAYGFAPGKVLNVRIPSTDNATLGAWFVFSEPYYQSLGAFPLPETSHPSLTDIPTAISRRPTVLWLHGNAATRAVSYRVALVSALSSRLDANVLAIDYRGYGDSTGVPSERGLVDDAWAAWKWLGERGAREQDVVIVGHSLGTGVGAAFANELVKSGGTARGLTLIAPFSSLATLLDTYYLLGLVPLMRPLEVFPGARQAVKYFLATHFDTSAVLPAISAHMPIVLAHADDDWDIPPTHSETLFERIVAPKLPAKPLPPKPGVDERAQREYEGVLRAYQEHKQMRAYMVKTEKVDRFGMVEKFGMHVLVRTHHGGHNLVGLQEGVQDAMRFAFKL